MHSWLLQYLAPVHVKVNVGRFETELRVLAWYYPTYAKFLRKWKSYFDRDVASGQ